MRADGDEREQKAEEKGEEGGFELLDKVQEFCMSQFLEEDFEAFARDNHQSFLDAASDATALTTFGNVEHKLEFTEVYNKFLEHFEAQITDFIKEEGGTVQQFHRECTAVLETLDAFSPRRFFIEILLATADYDRFFFLMMSEAQKYGGDETRSAEEDDVPRK